MKKLLVALAMIAGVATAPALTVDTTVSDHCVLLQNAYSTVKGTASANAGVTVTLGGTQIGSGNADGSGKFAVKVNPGAANATGRNLVVSSGGASVTVSDVLVGEVWLVSGQSNAFNPMNFSEYDDMVDTWKAELNDSDISKLRILVSASERTVSNGKLVSGTGSATGPLSWVVCSKDNWEEMQWVSPLAFLFGKQLLKGKNVPVGITLSGRGATGIGAFMTDTAYAAAKAANGGNDIPWGYGTVHVSDFITRLDGLAARGAIWSQGEAEAIVGGANNYRRSLKILIDDWRSSAHRNDSKFPVILCSTATFAGRKSAEGDYSGNYEGDYKSSATRWEQETYAASDPYAAVVHAIDLSGNKKFGYACAEHPDQKAELAERCYKAARNLAYGETGVAYRCPYPTEAFFNENKTKITVKFPSTVILTQTGAYTHFPFRVKNAGIQKNGKSVNPTTVTIGSDKHSLEFTWSNLTLGGTTSVAFCNVSGTEDVVPLYEMKIYDQNGFPIPPFEIEVADSSSGQDDCVHTWGTPSYSWSADGKTCTATATCTKNSAHELSSTVNATLTVTKEATTTATGTGTRTAVFTSPFTTQTKEVVIPVKGEEPDVPADGSAGVQLWANGPYWATKNVGATSETDGGEFFMWGDTTGYSSTASNPPFGVEANSATTGKTLDQLKSGGYVDSNGNLAKTYDAAYMTMGGTWRMPTSAEWKALIDNCTFAWDSGKKVVVVTGKDAYANAQICLPCPGYWSRNATTGAVTLGNSNWCSYYFSATPVSENGNTTQVNGVTVQGTGYCGEQKVVRYSGFCVRAVSTTNPGGGTGGDTHTHSWGSATYSWSSDYKTCTATRSCSGCSSKDTKTVNSTYAVVTAATASADGLGRYTATFSSPFTTQTKDVTIPKGGSSDPVVPSGGGNANGHDGVQLWKDGPYFATKNVGASSSSDVGLYFSWGDTTGYAKGSGAFAGKYVTTDSNLTLAQDAANANMGGAWRMPTDAEWKALIANCEITTAADGITVRGKGDYAANEIFLPNGGYYQQNGNVTNEKSYGFYLSSTPVSGGTKACAVNLMAGSFSSGSANRSNGYPVRGVIDADEMGSGSGTGEIDEPGEGGHTHTWQVTYTWSTDNTTCKASATCKSDNSHTASRMVSTTYAVVTQPTTSANGKGRFTATFTDTPFSTQTKDVTLAKLEDVTPGTGGTGGTTAGHEAVQLWKNGPYWATMNVGADTETAAGYYLLNNVASGECFQVPNGALKGSLVSVGSNKLWGSPWRMPTTAEAQTMQSKCKVSGVGTDSNGQPYVVISGNTTGYTDKSIKIPLAGYGNGKAVSDGNRWGTYGKYWTSNSGIAQRLCFYSPGDVSSSKIEMANGGDVGHGNYYTVRLVTDTAPTGGSTGSHTHSWGTASYAWASDYSTCTASATCTGDGSHVMKKTVAATYTVVTAPTTSATGTGRWTATFSDAPFSTQTKDVTIAKLDAATDPAVEPDPETHDHVWGTVSYNWSSDNSSCTASASCTVSGCKETTSKTVQSSYQVTVQPTETTTGTGVYTATFTTAPFTATKTKSVTIPATGSGSGEEPQVGPAYTSADWYVSPTGSDSNNGTSKSTPFLTIAKAVSSASAGQKICVMKGTYNVVTSSPYNDSAAIVLDKGVIVFGETGNPADVIVHNSQDWDDNGNFNVQYRVFMLNHENAVVSGLTIENGIARGRLSDPKFYGANLLIDSNGGTVENCIIQNGRIDSRKDLKNDPNTSGTGVVACRSAKGLISHCIIRKNTASMGRALTNNKPSEGAIVWMDAGTIRQSLITDNTVMLSVYGSALQLGGGALAENCTIAGNKYDGTQLGLPGNHADGGDLYPINIIIKAYDQGQAEGIVRNCLMYGNKTRSTTDLLPWFRYLDTTYGDTKKAVAKNNIINCATDCTLPTDATAVTSGFALDSDFRPQAGSTLIDAGATMGSPVDTDLAGYSRIQGSKVDIGCYEYGSSGPTPPPSHTHVWGTASYEWIEGASGYSCKASQTCSDCSETKSETVTASYKVTKEPTTSAVGTGTYTATFTDSAFTTQTKTVEIPKLHSHTYGDPTYSWSSDYKTCTASAKCTASGCNDTISQTVNATYSVVTAATADTDGLGRWTATFSSPYTTQTKDVVIPKSGSSDPVVPSGDSAGVQLWANGPYWATKNVGATSETDGGKFYMWGDTTGYSSTASNPPFGVEANSATTGKTLDQLKSAGYVDSNGNLAQAYDAAYQTMGGTWRMPTSAEWTALIANCTFAWDDSKKVLVVSGKDAYANAQIYLPCPGYWSRNATTGAVTLGNQNFCSYYFSATPVSENGNTTQANGVTVQKTGYCGEQKVVRYSGFCVRAVSTTNPGSGSGEDDPVVHTHSWGEPTYSWSADGKSCTATRACTGCTEKETETVTATFVTTKEATTEATGLGHYEASFKNSAFAKQSGADVTIPKKEQQEDPPHTDPSASDLGVVQLWENGPYWATNNLGAASESGTGDFYMWGGTVGYSKDGTSWKGTDGSTSSNPFGNSVGKDKNIAALTSAGILDANGNLNLTYDAAKSVLGDGWRLPTKEDVKALQEKCSITGKTVGGVKGVEVRGQGAFENNAIFLPCSGYGEASNGGLNNVGGMTYYITSTPADNTSQASAMSVTSSALSRANVNRNNGYQIRPVRDTVPSTPTETVDWDHPEVTIAAGVTAGTAWSALKSSALAAADAAKLQNWAKNVGKVAFESAGDIKLDAFLLNCANADAAIATAKAEFKFTAFDPEKLPTASDFDAKGYNGVVTIEGRASLDSGDWAAAKTGDHFFRAILSL